MSFSNDIAKFSSKVTSKLNEKLKKQTDEFLSNFLGDEFADIESYEFDDEIKRFHTVKTSDSVITKLREANYLSE
jgi:hypothetical protein